MFNINTNSGYVDEESSPTPFSGATQASFESEIDYFGARSGFDLYGLENVQPLQRSQSFTSTLSQVGDFTSVHTQTPISPNDGTIGLSLIRPQSLPGQEEKVPQQFRNVSGSLRVCFLNLLTY
jgi:hypothetical protein